jgi:hypothetical protein
MRIAFQDIFAIFLQPLQFLLFFLILFAYFLELLFQLLPNPFLLLLLLFRTKLRL